MKRYGYLVWLAYMVAAFTIVIPLLETVLQIWPIRPSTAQWRFGAVGIFSRALMTPFLGLLIALGTAHYLEHRRVVRTASILSALFALALAAVVVIFGLDALESRALVRPEVRPGFDAATILAVLKYAWAIVAFMIVAVGGWKASRLRGSSNHPSAPILAGLSREKAAS
jgi:hypothetical protein